MSGSASRYGFLDTPPGKEGRVCAGEPQAIPDATHVGRRLCLVARHPTVEPLAEKRARSSNDTALEISVRSGIARARSFVSRYRCSSFVIFCGIFRRLRPYLINGSMLEVRGTRPFLPLGNDSWVSSWPCDGD